MNDDITDTGPLKWSPERHSRAQVITSVVLVAALLAITVMGLLWVYWGHG